MASNQMLAVDDRLMVTFIVNSWLMMVKMGSEYARLVIDKRVT